MNNYIPDNSRSIATDPEHCPKCGKSHHTFSHAAPSSPFRVAACGQRFTHERSSAPAVSASSGASSFPALFIVADGAEVVSVDLVHDAGDLEWRRRKVSDASADAFSISAVPLALVLAAPGLLRDAEAFVSGFEGDESQEGIDGESGLLARLRAAVAGTMPSVHAARLLASASNILQVFADWEREGGRYPHPGTLLDAPFGEGWTVSMALSQFGREFARYSAGV